MGFSDYDRASNVALHSRFIGIARGFRISQKEASGRHRPKLYDACQELTRTVHIILLKLTDFWGEVADRAMIERIVMRQFSPDSLEGICISRLPSALEKNCPIVSNRTSSSAPLTSFFAPKSQST